MTISATARWKKYPVGTEVNCGSCGVDHAIDSVKIYDGGLGFELACGHRNAYCDKCEMPVKDLSALPYLVSPECFTCNSQEFRSYYGPTAAEPEFSQ